MPCGADLSGDLDLHQLLYQRTHRFAKEVHIRSGLVKKLLQRDANVGGHGGFLLPCCCCSNTHGTRSWPLASREQPPSGIYTTTWDSSPFRTADVKVPVYQKDPGEDVPVCYCFGWTRRRIRDELAQTGKSTASATIAAHVKAGRCGCEVNNPQGACCLGNVQAVVRQWKATLP